MSLRVLGAADATAYQSLRLAGLQECPSAFASSHAEEAPLPLETVAGRLTASGSGAVWGGFVGSRLVGVVGVQREHFAKLAHKAHVWGMYVKPGARRQGIGRLLLGQALDYARRELGVHQVNLGVNAGNEAALRLYEALGFRPFGLERGFMMLEGVAQDEVHLVCE
ncbi:MAG: GNAT family N-acetyltransferase, partial [Pseudomonadota bacterium]|nr:GNAT family N-acetyltransferase [Pseudomonadota bacterium]